MNFEIVVATKNEHKMKELREMLGKSNITLYSLNDLNIDAEIPENGTTYYENALQKARFVQKYTSLPILADDSGIEISFLGDNFPGVNSHRFQIEKGGAIKCNQYIIDNYINVRDRYACFHCCLVLLNVKDKPLVFNGMCEGVIDTSIRGENGFGYDPIFISKELNKNLGLAKEDEKNKVSHRYHAFKKLIAALKIYNLI